MVTNVIHDVNDGHQRPSTQVRFQGVQMVQNFNFFQSNAPKDSGKTRLIFRPWVSDLSLFAFVNCQVCSPLAIFCGILKASTFEDHELNLSNVYQVFVSWSR